MSHTYTTIQGKELTVRSETSEFVEIGELPLLSIAQFAGYASLTLAEKVIPNFTPSKKSDWATYTSLLLKSAYDLPIRPPQPPDTLYAPNSRDIYVPYTENPFVVPPDEQNVRLIHGGKEYYTVAPDEFLGMTYNTFNMHTTHMHMVNDFEIDADPLTVGFPREIREGLGRIYQALQ